MLYTERPLDKTKLHLRETNLPKMNNLSSHSKFVFCKSVCGTQQDNSEKSLHSTLSHNNSDLWLSSTIKSIIKVVHVTHVLYSNSAWLLCENRMKFKSLFTLKSNHSCTSLCSSQNKYGVYGAAYTLTPSNIIHSRVFCDQASWREICTIFNLSAA